MKTKINFLLLYLFVFANLCIGQNLEKGELLMYEGKFEEAYEVLKKVPKSDTKEGKKEYKKAQSLIKQVLAKKWELDKLVAKAREDSIKTELIIEKDLDKNIFVYNDLIYDCKKYYYNLSKIYSLSPRINVCKSGGVSFQVEVRYITNNHFFHITGLTIKTYEGSIIIPKLIDFDSELIASTPSIKQWSNHARFSISRENFLKIIGGNIQLYRISEKGDFIDLFPKEQSQIKFKAVANKMLEYVEKDLASFGK